MSKSTPNLMRQLTADKKKLSAMVCLLAVGLLLWGRLLLKDVPRTATAVPPTQAVTAGTPTAASASSPFAAQRGPDVTVVVDMPRALTRDMFALDTTGYRVAKKGEEKPVRAKVEPDTPDKAYRVAKATELARGLSLEGIVHGDEPSVIFNGQVLQEGQTIEGLTVYRIENRRVVLELDGVYIRLSM